MSFPILIRTISAVTRKESDGGGLAAMGQWERRISARSGRSGNSWDDFEWNAMGGEVIHLFAETAEDARVATLETYHETTLLCLVNQNGVNLVLCRRMYAATLADRDDLSRRRNLCQKGVSWQRIMNDDIRLLEQT
jgi:hypothetical protein